MIPFTSCRHARPQSSCECIETGRSAYRPLRWGSRGNGTIRRASAELGPVFRKSSIGRHPEEQRHPTTRAAHDFGAQRTEPSGNSGVRQSRILDRRNADSTERRIRAKPIPGCGQGSRYHSRAGRRRCLRLLDDIGVHPAHFEVRFGEGLARIVEYGPAVYFTSPGDHAVLKLAK